MPHIILSCVIFLATLFLHNQSALSAGPKYYRSASSQATTSVSLDAGIRNNDFDWNIASDVSGTATPNILSELTWENIRIFEGEAKLIHEIPTAPNRFTNGKIVLEGTGVLGFTFDGENQDSDYLGDNRTLEFSRSNNASDSGYTLGASAAIGYKIYLPKAKNNSRSRNNNSSISLMPLIGYGWDQQTYKMADGFQTIPATGAFPGLDSEYQANWQGPFAGLEAEIHNQRQKLKLRGEYHLLGFDAEAIWNLRSDFEQNPSFIHETNDAKGIKLDAEYSYALDSFHEIYLGGTYERREGEDGLDRTFFSTGAVGGTRLNEVNDQSLSLRTGLRYYW